ncbi:hypothetical protein RHGRI_032685 [Rhododendron griersonianum]|uniref:Alpha/beta hydrolase fold-3 domain-containing protein n=1 Tax=Rhododendron griersonianum TaxID=479676 RepID=A0AAV6IDA7_9ERIC|nr:hypothetical protein RHGRI_032685 [Rhododendron griersonianum]
MEPTKPEVTHEFPFFRVYNDGCVEKFNWPQETVPPTTNDPITGVQSRDAVISGDPKISARIFLPRLPDPIHKLPVLLYAHGGAFSMMSAFSPRYDAHVRTLAAEARVIAVSVEYRLAPEHPIPACYDDSWATLQWIAAHANGDGPDPWLNENADFNRVFVGGDSAGGNISGYLALQAGSIGLPGVRVAGAILVHPYFGGVEVDDKMWLYMCPSASGIDDYRMKPSAEDLGGIGCDRMLVFVAEKDHLCGPGKAYYENLKKSGWKGKVELVENKGEEHCFHLRITSGDDNAVVKKIVSFINQD